MFPNYQNSIDLLTNVTNTKLYKELIIQLNKDFGLAGIDTSFSEESTPLQLKEGLQTSIKELILHDFSSYTNLLYRIDVSEKDTQIVESTDMNVYTENVTFLILKRIWKKVWFKHQFSK
ncbi:hypothetical protein C7448_10860 [Tenacibaculum gallaicum]|uniref:Uncharacterized protein n=1 Tax=Tenacibaculum gallaicum TaxID=561505 RepID=A0A3E0HJ73_9FLAO|nr:hypothetical protein [Tenacibaculum gallaicum]REH46390.1 hypothetical protein C7448_10860 [Tenacibaculum gallaicum]